MIVDRRQFLQHAAVVLGGALSTSCMDAVLQHDPASPLTTSRSVLTTKQELSVDAVVERILPATDTPGANDVGVTDFVDFMLAEGYRESQVALFMTGLERLDAMSIAKGSPSFVDLTPEEQDAILKEIEAEELAANPNPFAALFNAGQDRAFFALAKELTSVGYFTSEDVVKNQFTFSHAAGYFDPCAELKPGDKPWYGGL